MGNPTTLPPDDNRAPLQMGVMLTLLALALIHVGLRLHTRIFLSRAVGWDDYCAVFSVVLGTVQIGLTIKAVQYGYGRHFFYLAFNNVEEAIKYVFLAEPFNCAAVAMQKVSIGVALLRLNLGRIYNTTVWLVLIPNIALALTTLVVTFARCRPLSKNWNLAGPGHCWPLQIDFPIGYAGSASNILADIVFAVSPIIGLAKVQLSKYNKWALRVIFLLGLFATVCSIVKIAYLPALNSSDDFTYEGIPLSLWATGELMVGLMVACAPALKPRYESFIRKVIGITNLSSSRSRGHGYGAASKYGTASSKIAAYGSGRSDRGGFDDDTEDLKLDYFYRPSDMQTTHVETGAKIFASENSSDDIIFQSTDARGSN